MSFAIIVSRYNEPIHWTNEFPNVLIFNKGVNDLGESYNQIMLDNVGREGHTYYKYIVDNYDNLKDYTCFLQGNPFDHSPNIIDNLHRCIEDLDITNFEIINTVSTPPLLLAQPLKGDFRYLSERVFRTTLDLECSRNWQCKNIHSNFEKIFGMKCTYDCIFGAGAQFIVSKDRILKRPVQFYEAIVKMLEYTIDPIEGHDIERFHQYIFS
jgi:hypothetical protein